MTTRAVDIADMSAGAPISGIGNGVNNSVNNGVGNNRYAYGNGLRSPTSINTSPRHARNKPMAMNQRNAHMQQHFQKQPQHAASITNQGRPMAKVTAKGYNTAQYHSRMYKQNLQHKDPNGSHTDDMFKSQRTAPNSPQHEFLHPTMCMPMPMNLIGINTSATACVSDTVEVSKDYAKKYEPKAKQGWHKAMDVAEEAGRATAAGVQEFSITAAEVYRQECRSNDRGNDDAFFVNPQSPSASPNDDSSIVDANTPSRSRSRGNGHISESSSSNDDRRRRRRGQSRGRSREPRDPEPFQSHKGMRYPKAIHIMKEPVKSQTRQQEPPDTRFKESEIFTGLVDDDRPKSTPRRKAPAQTGDSDNNKMLREARLQLFKMGQNEEFSESEVRLVRALDELKRQDETIEKLHGQLRVSTKALNETTKQLEESRLTAQKRQYASTETRAKAVQEKKRLETILAKEINDKRKFKAQISQLQTDAAQLKVALRMARSKPREEPEGRSNPQTPTTPEKSGSFDKSASSTAQLIAMRAELVDLRSQLAEAHAAKIDDSSSVRSTTETERLTSTVVELNNQLNQLRQIEQQLTEEKALHAGEADKLRRTVKQLETKLLETEERLTKNLKTASETENSLRAELIKSRANAQRLERERQRKRTGNNGELERLKKQLVSAKDETSKLKQKIKDDQLTFKNEVLQLKNDMNGYRKRMTQNNQQGLLKGTEHMKEKRRWEKENTRLSNELRTAQEKCVKNETIITTLEHQLKTTNKPGQSAATIKKIHSRQEAMLKEQLSAAAAHEASLQAELKLQTQLRDVAERKSTKFKMEADRNRKASLENTALRQNEKNLKQEVLNLTVRLSEMGCEEKKSEVMDDVETRVAKEQAYLNEIFMLKNGLREAQNKAQEERFQLEESLRVLQDNETKRVAEIEQLQKHNEEARQEDAKLRAQMALLKRQIGGSSNTRPYAMIHRTPSAVFGTNDDGQTVATVRSLAASVKTVPAEIGIVVASQDSPATSTSRATGVPPAIVMSASTSTAADQGFGPDSKLSKLRKELSAARARLAAARGEPKPIVQSKQLSGKETAASKSKSTPVVTPEKKKRRDIPTTVTTVATSSSASATTARTAFSTPAINTAATTVTATTTTTAEEPEDSLAQLQKELEQSSMRLTAANRKLEGLVNTNDSPRARSSNNNKAVEVAKALLEKSAGKQNEQKTQMPPSRDSDSINEVTTTASEGGFEVTGGFGNM